MGTDYIAIKEITDRLTLEEKAKLCSGADSWHTKGIERLGVPSVMMTDGPHGLRKMKSMDLDLHSVSLLSRIFRASRRINLKYSTW